MNAATALLLAALAAPSFARAAAPAPAAPPRDPAQLAPLFAVASSTSVEVAKAQAAWTALVETALENPAPAKALLPGWLRSRDPEQRFRALALTKEGVWAPAFAPLVRQILLKDADEENRAEAALTLGANEVHAAKPDLLKAARDRSAAVREAAGEALAALESADAD